MNRQIAITILLLVASNFMPANRADAQYYDSRVLQKSFDKMDLFFTPGYVNPYGFDGFGPVASGLLDDVLLDIQVNPAFPALDSVGTSYGYLDFRQSRAPNQPNYYCCDYLADNVVRDQSYYYPYYPSEQPAAPEPLFVAAYQAKPSARISFGVTYQLLFRDTDYFAVASDIYRSSATEDFASNRVVQNDIYPIVDVSNGENNMRTVGHQASVNVASTAGHFAVGARVAGTLFDRSGSIGNSNRWVYTAQELNSSLWQNLENRSVDYRHLDVSAGALYSISASQIGVSAGFLSGKADQLLTRTDTSFYQDGVPGPLDDFSRYSRSGTTQQDWNHNGRTNWIGINAKTALTPKATLSLIYRTELSTVDLKLASIVSDTSNNAHRYSYADNVYASSGYSSVSDIRSGNGTTDGIRHRGAVFARWQIDSKTQLSLGGDVNSRLEKTNTSEDVVAKLNSFYSNEYDAILYTSEYGSDEVKTLNWRFRTRTTTLSVPIHVRTRLSDKATIEIGLNRRLVLWNIEDETTALYDYRILTDNGTTTRRDSFGERFREPQSRESEVRTTFLFGVTVSPSPSLDVRILVAPEHRRLNYGSDLEMRWWVGLALHP